MDDYSPIASAIFRFAVAFLQADAGGERVCDALEQVVPPSNGAEVRVRWLDGQADLLGVTDAQVREVVERFGRLLPDHLASCGVRPGMLRVVGVDAIRGPRGRLGYWAFGEDDLGRWYSVRVVLPAGLPVGFVIGDEPEGATAGGEPPEAEPDAAPDPARM